MCKHLSRIPVILHRHMAAWALMMNQVRWPYQGSGLKVFCLMRGKMILMKQVHGSNKSYESSQGPTRWLDLWDQLGECFEHNLMAFSEPWIACLCSLRHELYYINELYYITANDLDEYIKLILHTFALKIQDHQKDDTFERLPFVFQNHTLPSWRETRSYITFLSGLHPAMYVWLLPQLHAVSMKSDSLSCPSFLAQLS